MSAEDRARWDGRYAGRVPTTAPGPPAAFAAWVDVFPITGHALDLACGRGQAAIWLACRGLAVLGVDVSPVAIDQARELAHAHGIDGRCRFEVADLDDGLPPGPPADVIVCHRFRDPQLDQAVVDRLAPGGVLAISALSEVGAEPGPFRVRAGELERAFNALEIIVGGEGDGEAWLLGRM